MNLENVLVLGSNSFSGNSFSANLPDNFARHLVYRTELLGTAFDSIGQLRARDSSLKWNLNQDPSDILELIEKKRVTTIVNFAAQSMVGQSWERPEDWYEANVLSFSRLLKGIAKLDTVSKFVQFSTPEVYGSTDGWIKENFNFAPNTPYAVSRAASDWHLKALHENFGFPVIFTRAANVYGEHQRLYRIVPRVILSALTGQKLPLQGGGRSIRSFIHIKDVNDALFRIIQNGTPGDSYHISTNDLVTIHDLVAMVANKLNVKFEDLVEIAPDRPGKDYAYQLDSQKIRSELGWKDKISLSDGIDRTIKWVQNNIDELKQLPLNYEHRR